MRAVGAILIASAFLAAGLGRATELRRRAALLAALASALEIMRGEVARLSALDEAAARLARSGPEPTRGFFTLFGAGLERLGELEVSELWDAAARTLPLTPDEREALSAAGRCLGRYGAEEQLAALGRSIEELSACALRARERAESGGRLYTGAGLAAGLLAAIVLY